MNVSRFSKDFQLNIYVIDSGKQFCAFLLSRLSTQDKRLRISSFFASIDEAKKRMQQSDNDIIIADIGLLPENVNAQKYMRDNFSAHTIFIADETYEGSLPKNTILKPQSLTDQDIYIPFLSKLYELVAEHFEKTHPTCEEKSPVKESTKTNSVVQSNIPSSAADVKFSPFAKNTLIVIGASTGGTETLLAILKELPKDTPGIVITQHMPENFTKMYAERLNKLCKMSAKEAEHGDIVTSGQILVAPGGEYHTKVVKDGKKYVINCYKGEKVSGHRPSVDVLFNSAAQAAGRSAVGVILTGMGQDGAYGLLEMKKLGAYTIGQDEASCVVYGMPKVAFDIGAVTLQVPYRSVASSLIKHLTSLGTSSAQ